MKNNTDTGHCKPWYRKIIIAMRNIFILLILVSYNMLATTVYSQTARFDLNMNNQTLNAVFDEIERKSEYSIILKSSEVDLQEIVSIQVHQQSVDFILDQLLKKQNLLYEIKDRHIIIYKSESNKSVNKQEEKVIKGVVLDENNEPIIGANVVEKGTTNGSITDIDGRFSLTVSKDATLEVSYIGYLTSSVSVQNKTTLNIILKEDSQKLEEVVVVGYGVQKKVNLTGSISVIDGDKLLDKPVPNLTMALQGTTPGLTIFQTSGQPGQSGTVRIRGIGSKNAGDAPLVLIDNVERSMNDINMNDVASISVLKDAAAASIYGSRAANGVILITTKRGSEGINVSYSGYVGWQSPTNMPKKLSALEHMKYYDIARTNMGTSPKYTEKIKEYETLGVDNFNRFDTDWEDLVLTGSGLLTNQGVSVSSGTEKFKYLIAGNYTYQDGVTENTNYKRMNLRMNSDVALTKQLSLSVDVDLNNSNSIVPSNQSPDLIMRSVIGMAAVLPGVFDNGKYGEGWLGDNPVARAKSNGIFDGETNTNIIAGKLTYKPFEGMEISGSYNTTRINYASKRVIKQYDVYIPNIATGEVEFSKVYPVSNSITEENHKKQKDVFQIQASYQKKIKKNNFLILGGFSTEEYSQTILKGQRSDMLDQNKPYLDMASTTGQSVNGNYADYALMSFYGRATYNYAEKYLLEINGRYDGSSRFRKGNRWAFFPSFSAGWRFSEESFWTGLRSVVNNAKIRFSIGEMGNQNVGGYYPTYTPLNDDGRDAYYKQYYFDRNLYQGYISTTAANTSLTWEVSKQYDIGLDLHLFDSKLVFVGDYFRRNISNMLLDLPIPDYVGVKAPLVNAGAMYNKGWEISLDWKSKVRNVNYNVIFTLTDIQNKVTDLAGVEYISDNLISREGYNLYSYYGYKADGYFQSKEEIDNAPKHYSNTAPGDIRYQNIVNKEGEDSKGEITVDDRVILGNHMPRYEFGLTLGAEWKGFDINLFIQGVGKRDNYLSGMGTRAFYSPAFEGTMYEYQKDFWTEGNRNASYPRLTIDSDNNYQNSSFWIKSGAYLRLKSATIGYTIPPRLIQRIGAKSLRMYVSGQNLFTIDSFFDGFDPEIPNSNGSFYPIMQTFSFGLNLNF